MKCKCGGWQYCTVAEVDGRQQVVVKCKDCGEVQPISRQTPLVTESQLDRAAMGRVWS